MNISPVLGKTLVFVGLSLAVILGIRGLRSNWTTVKLAGKSASITELDRRAQPFFDEAQKNIPRVVAKLTETKTLAKICWLEVRDKASGSHELQKLVQSFLEKPILEPCRKGASVYGCAINSEAARQNVSDVGSGAVTTVLYSTAGLALEAVFLKSTLRSMRSVLGGVTGRLSSVLGSGAALAIADGPLPVGDMLGVALAVGGTALSIHDLKTVQSQLPGALTEALRHSVEEYRVSARMEAAR